MQVGIRRVTRLTQGVKCLLGNGALCEELRTACIVGARTLCSRTRPAGALCGRTDVLCAAAALRTREIRPGMGKRRLIAQTCRREITPFDACGDIARTHLHPLVHEDFVDVAALLHTDLDTRRLHRSREEPCASLLLHIRAIGEHCKQDEGKEQNADADSSDRHTIPPINAESLPIV